MSRLDLHIGYVLTDTGSVLVQLPDESPHGFALASEDQSWPGGLGIAREWTAIADSDPRVTADDRERLSWLLEEARS